MNEPSNITRIAQGIKRYPWKFLMATYIVYITIWTIIEPLLGLVKPLEPVLTGQYSFLLLLLISVLIGLIKVFSPKQIVIHHQNNIIRVVFGNLFSFEGLKAIPVSRFFYETDVVKTSLLHQVIHEFINSDEGIRGLNEYECVLDKALHHLPYELVSRSGGEIPEKKYALGTTVLVERGNNQYLFFALTQTELQEHQGNDNCNVTDLWISLNEFWFQARRISRGRSVNIPLIGSGVTGIKLSPQQLLQFNLLSIINGITEGGKITTKEIRIILHPRYYEEIDLESITKNWK